MDRLITPKHIEELRTICPDGVKTDISLADISSWRIGGPADCIVEPSNPKQLKNIMLYAKESNIPVMVFGATTNLLFADEGLRALAIKIGSRFSRVEIIGNIVTAEAGIWTPLLARKIAQAGLSGAEHIVGIPGTLGGLIYMNGGSNRQCIGESVLSVCYISKKGDFYSASAEECDFSYRSSFFQRNREHVVYMAKMLFAAEDTTSNIRKRLLKILKDRRMKFPRKMPNCGSVFRSDPEMYNQIGSPGLVIESCGLKGFRIGDAVISTKHSNFITNIGRATAKDVIALIKYITHTIHFKTGFLLQTEIISLDQYGDFLNITDTPKIWRQKQV